MGRYRDIGPEVDRVIANREAGIISEKQADEAIDELIANQDREED